MHHRSFLVSMIAAALSLASSVFDPSQAGPFAGVAANSAPERGALLAGYDDCGWDYPCPPPRPVPRRRPAYRRSDQVYIQNNYGTVNVYGRRGHASEPAEAPVPCCDDRERRDARTWEEGAREERDCGPNPCERCGPICWYRRFKRGYCGHGCEVYRERVRFERAKRTVVYPRPVYRRDPPPGCEDRARCPEGYEPEEVVAPPPASREPDPDPYPRRRFEGPQYPPN